MWSVGTFVVFLVDKRAAAGGSRRVRERTLHILAAMGGWPGTLVAMRVVRHKNRKVGFVAATLAIAAVHLAIAAAGLYSAR